MMETNNIDENKQSPALPLKVGMPQLEISNGVTAKWNTSQLGLRMGADAASAATASAMIAPVICIIDRSVIEKVATGEPLTQCLMRAAKSAVLQPHNFLTTRPFLLLFGLYFSTYMTANTIDTATSTVKSQPIDTADSSITKFVGVSSINMTLCVYKDTQFAKIFGRSNSPAATIPKLSYLLFAVRDSATIFASFNLPPMIAPKLAELPAPVKERFSRFIGTEAGRMNTTQFLTPAIMQIFSTPIHLLALDLYNRQGRLSFSDRVGRITRDWGVSAVARMGRIVPAFGVGGVVNSQMRKNMMARIQA